MKKKNPLDNQELHIDPTTKSKEKTLELAGLWNDLSDDLFDEFTTRLHEIRTKDRQMN